MSICPFAYFISETTDRISMKSGTDSATKVLK